MNLVRDALIGLAIGDALGVPVEFKKRAYLKQNPVYEMMGYGTHNQPPGTWSDDSSLTFCLAESLANKGYDLIDIAQNIYDWFDKGLWTAHGKVFDIGGQTRSSIDELAAVFKRNDFAALRNRETDNEYSNGNGALMRILPLAFYTFHLKIDERFQRIKEAAELTHGHIRSTIACFIYVVFAEELIEGKSKKEAYLNTKQTVLNYFSNSSLPETEKQKFFRVLELNIADLEESEIKSDGYVVHSLEASIWCLMNYDNYKEIVLAAVNLGEDTDTTAAIVGGLAGLYYGIEGIPENWQSILVKREKIVLLADKLAGRFEQFKINKS